MCQITVFLEEFWSYAKFSFAYTDTESSVSKGNKYLDLNWTKITGIKPSRAQSRLYKLVFVCQKALFLNEIKLKLKHGLFLVLKHFWMIHIYRPFTW